MKHTTVTIQGVTVEFGYNDGADIPITVRLSVGKSGQVNRTAWIARSADKDQMAWPNTAIGYLNRLRERHDLPRLDDAQRTAVYMHIIGALGGLVALAADPVQSS